VIKIENLIVYLLLIISFGMMPCNKEKVVYHDGYIDYFYAIVNGKLDQVRHFVEKDGADVTFVGSGDFEINQVVYGTKPIHIAAMFGHLEIVKYLVEEEDVDVNSLSGYTTSRSALHCAAEEGHLDIVRYLVGKKIRINLVCRGMGEITALVLAIKKNHLDIVKYLVLNGATLGDFFRGLSFHGNFGQALKFLNSENFEEAQKYIDAQNCWRSSEYLENCSKFVEYLCEIVVLFDQRFDKIDFALKKFQENNSLAKDLVDLLLLRSIYLLKEIKKKKPNKIISAIKKFFKVKKATPKKQYLTDPHCVLCVDLYNKYKKNGQFRNLLCRGLHLDKNFATTDLFGAIIKKIKMSCDALPEARKYKIEKLLILLKNNKIFKEKLYDQTKKNNQGRSIRCDLVVCCKL